MTVSSITVVELAHFTSFRELDVQYAQAKGWAFKRFKALGESLIEGEDFAWFHQLENAGVISALREQGRIYSSTANLVMLSPSGLEKFNRDLSR